MCKSNIVIAVFAALVFLTSCTAKAPTSEGSLEAASMGMSTASYGPVGAYLPTGADKPGGFVSGIYLSGVPHDASCCWINGDATLTTLGNPSDRFLYLRFFVPAVIVYEKRPLHITVETMRKVYRLCCYQPGSYSVAIKMDTPRIATASRVIVHIICGPIFIPKVYNLGPDIRPLTLVLNEIGLRAFPPPGSATANVVVEPNDTESIAIREPDGLRYFPAGIQPQEGNAWSKTGIEGAAKRSYCCRVMRAARFLITMPSSTAVVQFSVTVPTSKHGVGVTAEFGKERISQCCFASGPRTVSFLVPISLLHSAMSSVDTTISMYAANQDEQKQGAGTSFMLRRIIVE